ncbi:unnamed protein product [Closterium sp. NIES-54]
MHLQLPPSTTPHNHQRPSTSSSRVDSEVALHGIAPPPLVPLRPHIRMALHRWPHCRAPPIHLNPIRLLLTQSLRLCCCSAASFSALISSSSATSGGSGVSSGTTNTCCCSSPSSASISSKCSRASISSKCSRASISSKCSSSIPLLLTQLLLHCFCCPPFCPLPSPLLPFLILPLIRPSICLHRYNLHQIYLLPARPLSQSPCLLCPVCSPGCAPICAPIFLCCCKLFCFSRRGGLNGRCCQQWIVL